MMWWLKCFAVYRSRTVYFATREARDAAVAEFVSHGFSCAYNN